MRDINRSLIKEFDHSNSPEGTAGTGAVYADRLAKRGDDLILVARNEKRLKELSGRLTRPDGSLP